MRNYYLNLKLNDNASWKLGPLTMFLQRRFSHIKIYSSQFGAFTTQSQQIPYEVVPTIELWHHAHDIMIDSQEIKLHAWLLDNVLLDLAHIVQVNLSSKLICSLVLIGIIYNFKWLSSQLEHDCYRIAAVQVKYWS